MTKQDDQAPNELTVARRHDHGTLEKMVLGSLGTPHFPCHVFFFKFQTFIVFYLPLLFFTILTKLTCFVCQSQEILSTMFKDHAFKSQRLMIIVFLKGWTF